MSSQNLNQVSHGGLVRRDGMVTVHLHYERPHDAPSLGVFYREFSDYHLRTGVIPMKADIGPDPSVIHLIPLVPTCEIGRLEEVSRAVGFDGPLHFIDPDDCTLIQGTSHWEH